MKHTKRILALVLAITCMASVAAISVSAASSEDAMPITQETLPTSTFSQQIPRQVAEIQGSTSLDEESRIEAVLALLFEAKRDQNANPTLGDFDFSIFWDPQSSHQNNLTYFERSVKAEKELFAIYNEYAANSYTELTFNSISVNGDTAEVSVYEWFGYTYCDLDAGVPEAAAIESGRGFPYTISMRKVDSAWLITNIDFYNEATDYLRNSFVDVEAYVEASYTASQVCEPSILLGGITEEEFAETYGLKDLTVVKLNTTHFLNYATTYGGSRRNSLFPDFSNNGGDCQNFASQCLWFGLGGTPSASTITSARYPMVNATMSPDSTRQWFVMTDWTHSATWTGVNSFASHVENGTTTKLGLYGNTYKGVANARVGDILQISDDNGASYYHSYVVVNVTGSTPDQIYVSSHTSDRQNEKLSVCSPNDTYRIVRIIGVVYVTPGSLISPID